MGPPNLMIPYERQANPSFHHICCKINHLPWKSSIKAKALPSITSTMAPRDIATHVDEVSIDLAEPHQAVRERRSPDDLLGRLSHDIFRYDCLDRTLKRHHVTGNCPLDYHKDCSLMFDRNCFLGCGWHWSVSNFRTDYSPIRSRRRFGRIPVRGSYHLRGHAISRRDGQCKTSLWGHYGLPRSVC